MRFASIGSGSQGNGTLIDNGSGGVLLLDCGFSAREARNRLAEKSLQPTDLAAILVTHEHGDHCRGVATLANALRLPVYCTWGTYQTALSGRLDDTLFHRIEADECFSLADITVQAVAVPHDAREPCQFVFSSMGNRLGVLSDVGSITHAMITAYQNCDALMLECNHDLHMLASGSYPAQLKRRVAGHYGHFENRQAAEFLSQVANHRLQYLVATHISQKNNTPQLALQMLGQTEGAWRISAATQESGFDWIQLQAGSDTHQKRSSNVQQLRLALDF